MEHQEVLDLVNESDEVIGTILRDDYQKLLDEKLGYIRASDLFIVNDAGELWIPKRTANKTIAPNGLDFSMGGHVDSGETYIEATIREASEELNIDLSEKDLILISKSRHDAVRYFNSLYLTLSNKNPEYNPADFVSALWLRPNILLAMLDSGVAAKPNLKKAVEDLLASDSYRQILNS